MCFNTSNIDISVKISIKAPIKYYKYYNNYISKNDNKETDLSIIDSLCAKYTLPNINPINIGSDCVDKNINSQCMICYEDIKDDYIIVSNECYRKHFVCYECFFNYNYIKKKSNDEINEYNLTCCPYCQKKIDDNKYYILNNKNNNIDSEIYNLYDKIYNKNYEYLYRNISIKSIYFVKNLIESLYKYQKKNKLDYSNPESINIILNKNIKWITSIKYLINILSSNTERYRIDSLKLDENMDKILFFHVNSNIKNIDYLNELNVLINKINSINIIEPNINIILTDPLNKYEIEYVDKLIDEIKHRINIKKIYRYQYVIQKTIDDNIYKKKIVIM